MLRYDHHPSRQRDAVAQRQAILDTVVDYRFFAPQKIAADELRARELARAAMPKAASRTPAPPRQRLASLRHRLGAALIAAGTRLQGTTVAGFDPSTGT